MGILKALYDLVNETNCKDKDGKEISNLCVFDKGQIGNWTLLEHSDGTPQEAVKKFLGPQIKAASANEKCLKLGGTVSSTKPDFRSHKSVGICQFSDKSCTELETLFRGYADPTNAKLVEALKKGRMETKPFHLPMD